MFTNKKEKKAAWDEFVNDNAARECGLIHEPDEDLEREREQERFGRMQTAWVTGGHEQ